MKRLPLITVITPSYNQGQFIKETIESVLGQHYPFLEYWVMDGGSTDNTVKILKSYGQRINWISQKDKGQTDAINKGMKKAKGEIVCYLNSDDVMMPGALLTVAEAFLKNPNALWMTGDYIIIDAQGKEIQSFVRGYKRFFRNWNRKSLFFILNFINQPSTFWKRSAFKKIGYFNENLKYCMDYDFWLRLYSQQTPVVTEVTLSKFRIHSVSKGGSQYKQQFSEETKVLSVYTKNSAIRALHQLHSAAIVAVYNMIK